MAVNIIINTLPRYKKAFNRVICMLVLLIYIAFYHINAKANKAVQADIMNTSPIVMGYYSQWSIYSPNIHIQDLQSHLMTHLVYKSAYLSDDGAIKLGDSFADIEHLYPTVNIEEESILGSFGQLITLRKQQPHLKNIISIGGWKRSENFSSLSSTVAGRKQVAQSAIEFMDKYKFDGIEIDWQFPIYRSISPTKGQVLNQKEDANNLGLLMEEIKTQCALLLKKCWLQVVLAPYSIDEIEQANLLNDSTNAVVVDVSRIYGEKEVLTDHLSPLFALSGKRSVNQVINQLKSTGVIANKIVMGVPAFAVGWDGVPHINNGLGQSSRKNSWGSWDSKPLGDSGVYNQKSLSFFLASQTYSLHWDDYAKTSYLYDPKKFGGHFIAFESAESIAEKVKYVEDNNLAGMATMQLHNGDSVLKYTYYNFHFWLGTFYKIKDLWEKNSNILIAIFQFIIIFSIFAVVSFLMMNKRYSAVAKDKLQFASLKRNLQNLEWPLLNLLVMSPHLQKSHVVDNTTAEQLFNVSSQLLHPISTILSETKFSEIMTQQSFRTITLNELLKTTDTLLFINKQRRIIWQRAFDCELFIDPISLQPFFYNVCMLCCDNSSARQNIALSMLDSEHALDIILSASQENRDKSLNHAQLTILLQQAHSLGLLIKKVPSEKVSFLISFPSRKYLIKPIKQMNFSVNPPTDEAITDDVVNNKAASKTALLGIEQGKHRRAVTDIKNKQHENDLINNIELFNLSSMPSKDIYKGLEQACSFFINYLQQDSKVTIYQNEQLLAELGNDALSQGHEKIINANEFIIEIVTDKELNSEEEQLIQVLIYQTQMIQKAIKSLIKEPTILAELYELTRYKDQINYLKAESGYTGIYLQSKKDPRYISMRLRTIKLYFDDSSLIQIHRSYLVNAKKVSRIESVSKLKYSMVVGSEKLPISRTYITSLKENYPHWFK